MANRVCQRHSPAFGWPPCPGAGLILVPASLLGNWISEWDNLWVNQDQIRLRLYIQHRDFPDHKVDPANYKHIRLRGTPITDWKDPQHDRAHHFIICTTVESYSSQVRHLLGTEYSWFVRNHGELSTDCLARGRIIRDEAQLTTNYTTNVYKILQGLALTGWRDGPNFVPPTGTPMLRNGPLDMLGLIRIINLVSPRQKRIRDTTTFWTVTT